MYGNVEVYGLIPVHVAQILLTLFLKCFHTISEMHYDNDLRLLYGIVCIIAALHQLGGPYHCARHDQIARVYTTPYHGYATHFGMARCNVTLGMSMPR